MQLYIIRHAQSENNAIWAKTQSSTGRVSDPDITGIGHEQARLVADFLARTAPEQKADYWDSHNRNGFNLTHLYSSYMLRAVVTGTYISKAIGLPLVAWDAIYEWGGLYEDDTETGEKIALPGANRAFFAERFPGFVPHEGLGEEEGWWNFRPYEPPYETMKRAARFLDELLERHAEDDRVGIVTHGGFADSVLKILLRQWPIYSLSGNGFKPPAIPAELQTSAPEEMWFRLNNCSISRIDFFPERFVVVYWNRVDFLPGELIT